MSDSKLRRATSRFLADYGMAVVLVVICVYYSLATLGPQKAAGEDAARQVHARLVSALPGGGRVLVVGREGEADARFVSSLTGLLAGKYDVASKQGPPAAVRGELDRLAAAGKKPDAVAATEDAAAWTLWTNLAARPEHSGLKVYAAQSYTWPTFLKADNVVNVANQVVVIAVLAVGMTLVIVTGGIDLSVGSLVAVSAVVTAMAVGRLGGAQAGTGGMVLGCLIGIAACGLVGAVNGSLVAFCRMPPFIATLGMMQVASGLAYILPEGQSVYDLPESFTTLGRGTLALGVPNAVALMLALYAVAHVVMARTVFGRHVYAVGGNPEAARLSGVRVRRVLLLVYVASGLTAGLGGVLLASQLKGGSPTYGQSNELYAIAAVVVGGTSLAGGSGKVLGTLIGALIIAVIQNGMNLTGVQSYQQKVVLGLIVLGAVMLDLVRKQGLRVFRAG